jgi:predicted PurR-regulated permease PerM
VLAITLALILGLGTLELFSVLVRPLALLTIAVTIGAAIAPIVQWLQQRIPRLLAIVLVYLVLVLILVLISVIIFPPIIDQAQQASDRIPSIVDQLRQWLSQQTPVSGTEVINTLSSQIGNISSTLVSLPLRVFSGAFEIGVLIFISIYGLIAAPALQSFILSLFPAEQGQRVLDVLQKMARAMGGFVRGSVLNGLVVGIASYVGLLIIGVDYALVLGLLAGMLELIPNLGPIIASIPMIAIALADSTTKALIVVVFVIVMQQTENHLLVPNIMRTQADISPLLTVLALFIGGAIGGLLGALVAIPLAAALRVFVLEVIAPAVRNWTGAEPQS